MQRIKLTPEELRMDAENYRYAGQTIQEMLQKLQGTHQKMNDNWEGRAWQKFDEEYQELALEVRDFEELMYSIHGQLQQVAQVVEETDQAIASKLGF